LVHSKFNVILYIILFKDYGYIVGLHGILCVEADLNSKHLKILFIGIFYCLKQMLKFVFKVLDQGYHFWILFKFNV